MSSSNSNNTLPQQFTASSGGGGGSLANFNTDPVAYLQVLCSRCHEKNTATTAAPPPSPSIELLPYLSSPQVTSSIIKNEFHHHHQVNAATICLLYVRAAAQHLPALVEARATAAAAAAAASKASGPASCSAMSSGGITAMASGATGGAAIFLQHVAAAAAIPDVQAEMQRTQMLHEISEALAHAAARCQPRSTIAETGILEVLECLLPSKYSSDPSRALIWPGPNLTPLAPNVLQVFLYAGQAGEAQRIVTDTWPRPGSSKGISVLHVLRYFYLRGMVHLECQNFEWAVRCFWTCLCIPADVTSALAVAAWKKLVLLQALDQSDRPQSEMTVLRTPKTTPICVSRFLTQAIHMAPPSRDQEGRGEGSNSTGTRRGGGEGEDHVMASLVPAPEDSVAGGTSGPPAMMHVNELKMANGALLKTPPRLSNTHHPTDPGCRAYNELVKAFIKVNRQVFTEVLAENCSMFAQDGNLPLVQLVEKELVKRQIFQWSRVFSVISLQKLSEYIGMPAPDLQNLLQSYAQQTLWKIQVSQTDDIMVHFPKQQQRPVAVTAQMQQKQAQDLAKLAHMMQQLDVSISTSPRFMALVRREGLADSKGHRGVEDV